MTQTAFFVTGTHGSGSELAARWMAKLGVCFDSVAGDCAPTDERLVRLDESILRDGCSADDRGVPDWGWTETEAFDVGAFERHREEAISLLARRRDAAAPWGLHDPLAVPLLLFWEQLLGATALYVLVYRAPWSCIAALVRLRQAPFQARGDYAVRLWCNQNRSLLDFHRRHPDRCLLVNGDEVRENPSAFVSLLSERTPSGFDPTGPDAVTTSQQPDDQAAVEPVRAMLARVWPECGEIYASLEQSADLPRHRAAGGPGVAEAPYATNSRPRGVELSVIVTCFNDGEYLAEAVASAAATCAGRHELIVVDDGSDDDYTLAELERLRASGIQVIVRPYPSGGPGAPRNAGIEASRGRYLLPLDADNRLRPNYARVGIAALDADPRVGVVYGDAMYFGAWKGRWTVGRFDLDQLLQRNFIDACAVMRREVWEESGGYDSRMSTMWEDYDLWLSAAERGWGFQYVPEVLFDYRVRRHAMTRDTSRQRQRAEVHDQVKANHPLLFDQGFAPALRTWQEWVQATSPPPPGGPGRWSGVVPPVEHRGRWRRYAPLFARHVRHPVMAARLTRLQLSVMLAQARANRDR
jgi:hypothetical protein